jgi:hypothetical protein
VGTKKPIQHPEYEKKPVSRRAVIRRIATVVGIGAAGTYVGFAPDDWPGSMRDDSGLRSKPRIRPITLNDYRVAKPSTVKDVGIGRGGSVQERLRKALDAVGGLSHYIQPGDIVLVKPNVAFDRSPNLGATTHPEIMEALIRMLLVDCRAQEVRVADNPIESPPDCFIKSGIGAATESGRAAECICPTATPSGCCTRRERS